MQGIFIKDYNSRCNTNPKGVSIRRLGNEKSIKSFSAKSAHVIINEVFFCSRDQKFEFSLNLNINTLLFLSSLVVPHQPNIWLLNFERSIETRLGACILKNDLSFLWDNSFRNLCPSLMFVSLDTLRNFEIEFQKLNAPSRICHNNV